MAQRRGILQTLDIMRENLRETLKETSALRNVSIEEEVLVGIENIDKTCSNLLRSLRHVETRLRTSIQSRASRLGAAWMIGSLPA